MLSFCTNSKIKFIIVTSEDNNANSKKVLEYISENIPCIPLPMYALDDSMYFHQIISSIFEIEDHTTDEFVKYIFQLCEGNPSKLKTVIQNLLFTKDAIWFSDEDLKAHLNIDKLKEYILSKSTNINLNLLNEIQNLILQIVISFGEHMTLSVIKELFLYLTQKMHIGVLDAEYTFDNELNYLVSSDVLKATENDGDFEISIGNDLMFFYLSVVMKKRLNRFQLSNYIFHYLLEYQSKLYTFYSNEQINSLHLLHLYIIFFFNH